MRTNTEKYEGVYGRKPRGYGMWMFEMVGTDGRGAWLRETVKATGTLAKARSAAVMEFKASIGRIKSVEEVVVLP